MLSPTTTAVPFVAGATQVVKAAGPCMYKGVVCRELSAATLVLRIWDNASAASGTIVDEVVLGANGFVSSWVSDGIWCSNGLFVERVSGTNYEGSVRLG